MNAPTQDTPMGLDSPEFLADPYPFYDRLRRQTPVYRTRMGYLSDAEVYLLARYQDCVDLTTDHRFRRVVEGAAPLPIPKALRPLSTDSMIMMDDPDTCGCESWSAAPSLRRRSPASPTGSKW